MDKILFERQLTQEGFELSTVTRNANAFVDTHTHPFEAKALILSGQISIQVQGKDVLYQPGQVFHLPAGTVHTERYGPQGVTYLVGRKVHPA